MTTTALAPYGEYEVEAAPVQEYEGEWELAHEDEDEAEEFFGALASLASRALSNPTLRRVGLGAARAALQAGGRAFSDQTGGFSRQAAGYLQGLLPQSEAEAEAEDFADPFRRIYPNRPLMEHIGHAASEAEDEDEAEALVSSLVPLAARAAPALHRASPQLTRAVATIGRQLRADPSTRPLVRALPSIVQRTAHTVNRQAAAGHRITPQRALHTLARQTARTLSSPRQLVHDYRRSQRFDHNHHARQVHHDVATRRHPGAPVHTHGRHPLHLAPGHPGAPAMRLRRRPYGWGPGYGTPAAHATTMHPTGVPHSHAHPHALHAHPHPAGPSYAPYAPYTTGPWRRYAPPPGAPASTSSTAPMAAPAPPGGYAGPGGGAWTCTCQWA